MTDTLSFLDAVVPSSDDFPGNDIVEAKTMTSSELVCQTCGKPLEYAGKGRKPKYCAEHKAAPATPRRASKRDDAIAAEAAEVLAQINGLIGLGLLLAPEPYKMPQTAAILEEKGDKFKEAATDALKASPTLARTIARAGGVSGSAALIVAYGMLAASVAPVAIMEFKSKRAG